MERKTYGQRRVGLHAEEGRLEGKSVRVFCLSSPWESTELSFLSVQASCLFVVSVGCRVNPPPRPPAQRVRRAACGKVRGNRVRKVRSDVSRTMLIYWKERRERGRERRREREREMEIGISIHLQWALSVLVFLLPRSPVWLVSALFMSSLFPVLLVFCQNQALFVSLFRTLSHASDLPIFCMQKNNSVVGASAKTSLSSLK